MAAVTSCESTPLVANKKTHKNSIFHDKTTLVELFSGAIHFLGFYKKV